MKLQSVFVVLMGAVCGWASVAEAGELILAERGKPAAYTIVRAAQASASEIYAAEELRDFLQQVTGVTLPIATNAQALPERAIVLGAAAGTDRIGKNLGEDGFRLKVEGRRLFVCGSAKRGALYGVYEILEKYAGCRWYASWHAVIPRKDRVCVPDTLDDTQIPAFAMRQPFWYDVMVHHDFSARLRVNGHNHSASAPAKFGGDSFRFGGGLGSCHTFNTLMPPDEFFDAHPEYFSFENGKRVKHPSQLCLTNPDVLRIVTERVLERIRKDPGAKFYGVSQNDWLHYCQCDACKAIDEEEESHAGTMIRFVNAVAERVEKEFPDAIIETLAYQYTRKPPKKTKVRHNVVPCLCTIECDFARPIDVSEFKENLSFRRDIAGWKTQTDQLYVWDYTTDFPNYTMPFANVLALQGNLKFFRDNNVREIFEQGAYQGYHGDFAELKAWLLAKWMWNPELPLEPLLQDFFNGYYGKGASFVRAYFDELHQLQIAYSTPSNRPLSIWVGPENPAIPDAFLEKAAGLWAQAQDAVKGDKATSYNVRMGAFSVDYMRLERLRRKGDKALWLSSKPVDHSVFFLQKNLAKGLLDRMDESKGIRLAESKDRHAKIVQSWRDVLARELPGMKNGLTRGELQESFIGCHRPGTWGQYVDDPKASDGKALKLFNTHYEWCSTLHMHRIEFEPGVKYTIRVRLRCDKATNGEAFWAGVYDPVAKKSRGQIQPRTDTVGADYAWYDVCTWEPNQNEYFWIGPGRFNKDGKSAIQGLWIDKVEILRVQETVPEVVDPRVHSYVTPKRVVWTSSSAQVKNAEGLLTAKYGQVPEKMWLKPSGCTLVNNGEPAGVVLDFGRELHGGLQIGNSEFTRGSKVRIRFGESVGEAMSEIGEKGATNDHAVRDAVYELPHLGMLEIGNSGFRFVRIDLVTTGKVNLEYVRAISLMRPMVRVGAFKSSDERLNRVWKTAVRTVHLCCQDYLWDGIKRDRLVWMGDTHPETRAILSVFGAADILPTSLDYAAATTPAKTAWMNGMPNYTLWFLRNVHDWYFYTGDADYLRNRRDYLRETVEHVLANVFGAKAAYMTQGFLDWPTQHNKPAVDAGTRGLVATTLDDAAVIMDVVGDAALAVRCRDAAKKVRTEKPEAHGAKSAAALLALGGLRDAKEMYRDVLGRNGHAGVSTFYGYYMLEAMSAAGENQRALDTVRDYWGAMLDMGATSFWEDFNVAWTNNATRLDEMPVAGKKDIHGDFGEFCYPGYRHSLCHGWSAGPAAWCINRVLGLEALDVGCRTVRVKPFLGDLAWAEGALPTPHGPVRVRHEKKPDGTIATTIDVPPGVKIVRE